MGRGTASVQYSEGVHGGKIRRCRGAAHRPQQQQQQQELQIGKRKETPESRPVGRVFWDRWADAGTTVYSVRASGEAYGSEDVYMMGNPNDNESGAARQRAPNQCITPSRGSRKPRQSTMLFIHSRPERIRGRYPSHWYSSVLVQGARLYVCNVCTSACLSQTPVNRCFEL